MYTWSLLCWWGCSIGLLPIDGRAPAMANQGHAPISSDHPSATTDTDVGPWSPDERFGPRLYTQDATTPIEPRLKGFAAYRNTERIAALFEAAGASGGFYRRQWRLDQGTNDFVGDDFTRAHEAGQHTWLQVLGTPASLSPHPELVGNEYGTGLPEYARFPPVDVDAWADLVIARIDELEASHGVVPEYVEVNNEIERVEWFSGTLEEAFAMYRAVAVRLQATHPDIQVGGPALAGFSSQMAGDESAVLAFLRLAAETGTPIDFVSWHHYAPANELAATDAPNRAKALADDLGLPPIATFVSEWNIAPSAEGELGPEFDGPHAAANLAGFLTTANDVGLDGSSFFLDVDEDDEGGIVDLAGTSLGSVTLHGIKKPVFRVAEVAFGMFDETPVPIDGQDPLDYNLRVLASTDGERLRLLVSNDVVTGAWLFARLAEEAGFDPAPLYERWLEAGGAVADLDDLLNVGLTSAEAEAVLALMPAVYTATHLETHSRSVALTMVGTPLRVDAVTRFDSTHNNPATAREAILPDLERVEADALATATAALSSYLASQGFLYTEEELLGISKDELEAWALKEGIPEGVRVTALEQFRYTLRDERFAAEAELNDLDATRVVVETGDATGVTLDVGLLRFELEPNSVMVIDLVEGSSDP